MRDNRHFLGKAFDMVRFLFKEGQGNEEREITILDTRHLDLRIHQLLDAFPDANSPTCGFLISRLKLRA